MADDQKEQDETNGGGEQPPGGGQDEPKRPQPVSRAEWAVAAAGLLLVLVVVGQLAREALRDPQRPPDVSVRADSVSRGRGGYVVHFTARNGGDATAAMLTLRATLAAPGDTLEREAQIDYLPARSERKGGFVFPRDPRAPGAGALRLEAVGYEEP